MWRRCSFRGFPICAVFIERHGGLRSALTFLFGDELPQFLGIADHRPGGWVFGGPFPKLLGEEVDVLTRLGREPVFDPPDFFEDRVRFHAVALAGFNRDAISACTVAAWNGPRVKLPPATARRAVHRL